jgi:hypothetical protein
MKCQIAALIIVLMFIVSPILRISIVPEVGAAGGLALDGSGFGSSNNRGGCTLSRTLTTLQKPDVIIALLVINDTTTNVSNVKDTDSLSWTLRTSQKGPTNVQIFSYYAIAGTTLFADNVTFGLNSASVATDCHVFGVSGANTAAPFDSNLGVPNSNSGTATITSLRYNTIDPNDFLIILEGWCAQGTTGSGAPQGFTFISTAQTQPSNCPADYLQSATYYKVVSTTQLSNTVSWSYTTQSAPFAIIGDAIQSTPYVSSISPFHGPSGSSVTITGTSFTGTTSVNFCGEGATFKVVSDTSVTATLPNCGTGNNLDVTVTNAIGTSPTSPNDLFYVDPVPPLTAFVIASSNAVDVGQLASFSCAGAGGVSPYSYAWTFGDGSSGTGASPSHTYGASGIMDVVCTVTDRVGNNASTQPIALPVYTDPSITSFTLTPANLDLGQRITFLVSTSGGNGSLTYSYANLPTGCLSANSSSFSCTPTSSGTYDVRVTVTDQGQETANSTLRISIAPPRVLGLPQTMVSALIFGAILGICAVVILSVVLTLRGKRGSQIRPSHDTESN